MKNIIYVCALLLCTSSLMAQEKPKETKEETEVKVVKIKDGDKTTEKKVKVVTRETASVKLNEKDKNKVNQDRVNTSTKVEKMVMVDNDNDENYDVLSKETYYKIGDKNYLFKPSDRGFDIAFNKDKAMFIPVEKALNTNANGHYLVNGESYTGIGYFNKEGNFVIQYYDNEKDSIETKTYVFAETNQ
ncbi:hypothetical protein L3X39_08760 [Sabulilitoribacter multivorans]|uniref:WG containing repeat-containing protein n=1 Tax=Flaviramulus multivorans TaxID=1304750 RepID=A0ABS9IJG4_9FLAO|nr:hypothetical protein [Flaviramulus multivorans]MCF7560727.1 hypothetical protein [Flaviramulus multivorans]